MFYKLRFRYNSAPREENREPGLVAQNSNSSVTNATAQILSAFYLAGIGALAMAQVDSSGAIVTPNAIGLKTYDYVSLALSNGNATETYTFKTGGSGGTTTNTIVIVYTDSTRAVISTVTKT